MELKVNVFDILSYMLPGFLYLINFSIIGSFYLEENFFSHIENLSNSSIVIIIIFSFILGHALQPLHKINFLKYLFLNNDKEKIIEPIVKQIDKNLLKIIEDKKYSKRAILERILKLNNGDLANSASRFLALSLFVRNLSFPFLLLSIIMPLTYKFVNIKIICILSPIFLVMSILLMYRYKKFELYAFRILGESIIAISLKEQKFFK